jgi:hypothetical protein
MNAFIRFLRKLNFLVFRDKYARELREEIEDTPKEDKDWITVVGIVGDIKDQANSPSASPAFWWPELQVPPPDMSLVIRAKADPELLTSTVQSEVGKLDPALAVADMRLMDEVADKSIAPRAWHSCWSAYSPGWRLCWQ